MTVSDEVFMAVAAVIVGGLTVQGIISTEAREAAAIALLGMIAYAMVAVLVQLKRLSREVSP